MGHWPSGFRIGGISNLIAGWAQALASEVEVHIVAVYAQLPDNPTASFAATADRLAAAHKHALGSVDDAARLLREMDVISVHQQAQWLPELPPAGLMMHNPPRFDEGSVWPPTRTATELRSAFRSAVSLQACSVWLADGIERTVGRRVDVVHPFVHPAFLAAPVTKGGHAVWAGRLVENKGLLDAVAATERTGIELKITDAAPGAPDGVTQRFRERLLGSAHVRLVPPPSTPVEMAVLLGGASVVLVPATREPFGMVAIEAQAAGVRTVVYRDAGLEETIGPAAIGVTPRDIDGLARAIVTCVEAPTVPEDHRAWIAQRFSVEASTQALLDSLGWS